MRTCARVLMLAAVLMPALAIAGDLAPPGRDREPVLLEKMPAATIAPVVQVAEMVPDIPPERGGNDAVSAGKPMQAMRLIRYDSEKRWRAWVSMRRG